MTSMTSPHAATPRSTDGHASLARIFWLYGVAVGIAMAVVLAFLGGFAPTASRVVVVLLFAYQVAWYVALWRAAGRYTGPALWKWAARAVVCMPLIGFLFAMAITASTGPAEPAVGLPASPRAPENPFHDPNYGKEMLPGGG